MEENIHDDKLDDYIRKSFEGHEEDPASDMWDRVEGGLLPAVETSGFRTAFRRYQWQAVAAVVILLLCSTLVCEHLYYEQKLRALSSQPGIENGFPEASHSMTPISGIIGSPNASDPKLLDRVKDQIPNEVLPQKPKKFNIGQQSGGGGKQQGIEQILPQVESGIHLADSNWALPPKSMDYAEKAGNPPSEFKMLTLDLIAPLAGSMQPNPAKIPQIPEVYPIQPLREPSGWFIGVQTTFVAAKEKSRTPVSRFGRPSFANRPEKVDISAIVWLRAGKNLNKRVSLESGIGYQKNVQTATHTPRFRFGDGIHQGPPFGTMRNFNYDLSTYSGTAAVSLRMEQTGTGNPPTDDEPVSLKITTTERVEMLRIPLLVGYRLAAGRWQGQLKAGLLGNFMLKNELDIAARFSQNARFQPVNGIDGYTLQLNRGKFFLGYLLSAGGVYKLNKQFSLVAEPSLVGDFPRNDKFNQRLPQRFLFGLNVGANYYF